MRIGILANSVPAAVRIYDDVRKVAATEVYVLLFPSNHESQARDLMRHLARLILKTGRWKSLRMILAGRVVYFRKVLDDPQSLARLKELNLDLGLHKSGTIYRRGTIECFRLGILNAHIGLLPKYRGRSVMEWSLVQGDPIGISVFFVDEGIDTGQQIVLSEAVDISHCKSLREAKQYLFDLDATFYRRAVEKPNAGIVTYQSNEESGRRYYVMSKLLQHVAQENLAVSDRQSAIGNRQ